MFGFLDSNLKFDAIRDSIYVNSFIINGLVSVFEIFKLSLRCVISTPYMKAHPRICNE